ncbi:MAG TPA: DinB family protein [Candidatus Krumholzibacteria bacterium]|nr:DinB family protein [Candidatus Krumholzibacteria bacterium]
MNHRLPRIRATLARTPATLAALLQGCPPDLLHADEGPDTWSPYRVLGHLCHGERTDWIPRARLILERGPETTFPPFDRFAQLREPADRPVEALLAEFADLRANSLTELDGMALTDDDLARRGRHPELGEVTLSELLSTWAAHDLGHVAQIVRVMAKVHGKGVGPWRAYLPVLTSRRIDD